MDSAVCFSAFSLWRFLSVFFRVSFPSIVNVSWAYLYHTSTSFLAVPLWRFFRICFRVASYPWLWYPRTGLGPTYIVDEFVRFLNVLAPSVVSVHDCPPVLSVIHSIPRPSMWLFGSSVYFWKFWAVHWVEASIWCSISAWITNVFTRLLPSHYEKGKIQFSLFRIV